MEVKYFLCNPTGNITGLVESDIPVERHPEVASKIMEKEPSCEQVGFLLPKEDGSDITLRMAGGEFCGNATMSTAAYFCKKNKLADGEKRKVSVKVIGTKDPISVDVLLKDKEYYCTLEMPRPIKISDFKFTFEGHNYWYPVVTFTGISHVIIEDDVPFSMPERCIKLWCDQIKEESLGLMLLNKDRTSLRPLVYVKNPESLVWESSCGSGTTAVGAYLTKKQSKPLKLELNEPGGKLSVETFENGSIKLSGKVEFKLK